MPRRYERSHRLPIRGTTRQASDPSPSRSRQSDHIGQIAGRGQGQAQGFDTALGKGHSRGAHSGLGCRAEPPGRPDENVVQLPVAIEIERVEVRVFMRPSQRATVGIASGQLGRRRLVPGGDADERAMQQLRLRQCPGDRRQRMVVAAGVREREEHGVDA